MLPLLDSLRLLSEPTRLRLLLLLDQAELTVAELQEILAMKQSRISTQLGLLKNAGLVQARRSGKNSIYGLDRVSAPLRTLLREGAPEIPEASADRAARVDRPGAPPRRDDGIKDAAMTTLQIVLGLVAIVLLMPALFSFLAERWAQRMQSGAISGRAVLYAAKAFFLPIMMAFVVGTMLAPAMKRPNLVVMTNARATKLLLEGQRVVGVEALTEQGLVTVDEQSIQVTANGWYFVRAVAMVFDRYLRADKTRERFSRII